MESLIETSRHGWRRGWQPLGANVEGKSKVDSKDENKPITFQILAEIKVPIIRVLRRRRDLTGQP